MTGKIFEIKRFAVHDGPGIRTTVFFKGCPLSCIWCHNPEGISGKDEIAVLERLCAGCGACVSACPRKLHSFDGSGAHAYKREECDFCLSCVKACMPGALKLYGGEYTPEELYGEAVKDAEFYKESGGGVTYSGGEPLMQADFTAEFLRLYKAGGLRTAVDTSGCAGWKAVEKVIPYTDIFLYDIKHMDSVKHKELTGVSNGLILENLSKLSGLGAPVEVRMPVITGLNDGEVVIRRAAEFLKSIKSLTWVKPLPYHALSGSKYKSIGRRHNMPEATGTENAAAERVSRILAAEGLPVIG